MQSLRKLKMENKDYTIVESEENKCTRFNAMFLEILNLLEAEERYKAKEECKELIKLYNELRLKSELKTKLGILLKELENKINLDLIEQGLKKEIKKRKLLKYKKIKEEVSEKKPTKISHKPLSIRSHDNLGDIRRLIKKGKLGKAKELLREFH